MALRLSLIGRYLHFCLIEQWAPGHLHAQETEIPFNELHGHISGGGEILFLEVAEFARDIPRRSGPIILGSLCRWPWNPAFRLGHPSGRSIAHDQSRQARDSRVRTSLRAGRRHGGLPTGRCRRGTGPRAGPIPGRSGGGTRPPRARSCSPSIRPWRPSWNRACRASSSFIARPARRRMPRRDSATSRSSARSAGAAWAWSMKPSSSRSNAKWP